MSKKIMILVILTAIGLISVGNIYAQQNSRNIRALFIYPNEFGANTNLNKDNLENLGWDLTTAAVQKIVQPCPFAKQHGLKPFEVDSLISQIDLSLNYDAIIITSASSLSANPCSDLLESNELTLLLNKANDMGIVVSAYCTSVRVLAKAGILIGKHITGNGSFSADYLNGGAIFDGPNLFPVVDGNIVTSTRGDYFYIQNSNAIENAVEQRGLNPNINNISNPVNIYNSEFINDDILWTQTYGEKASELSNDIIELEDASLVLLGTTYSMGSGFSDILLKKVSSNGMIIWEKYLGGIKRDVGSSVLLSDNYIYVAGTTNSFGNGMKDILIAKLNLDGTLIWTKYFGGDEDDISRKIVETSDNNILILAETQSYGNGEDDALIIKIDKEGNQLLQKSFGYQESEMVFDIIKTRYNNYLITGASGHFSDKRDIWIFKIDIDGNLIWEKSFGENDNNDWGFKVIEYNDYLYLTGKSDNHGLDFYNAALLKLDLNGELIYFNKFGETKLYEFGHSFIVDNDRIILTGVQKSYETSNDIFLIQTSLNGDVEKEKLISQTYLTNVGNDWVNKILLTNDKNFVLFGHTNSLGEGSSDLFLIKLSSLLPDYETDIRTGHAPLEIDFINKSSGPLFTTKWDFDNDGLYDSDYENDSFTFTTAGNFSPKITINDGTIWKSKLKENYIKVFDGESCLNFTTVESKLKINKENLIDFNKNFTIEMWLKSIDEELQRNILDKGTISVNTVGNSIFYDSCFAIQLKMENGDNIIATTPDNSLKENSWQHLTISFSEDQLYVYINGINQKLKYRGGAISGPIQSNIDIDLIVGNKSTLLKNFNGSIDELRIWNKYRTDAEVHNDYKSYLIGNEDSLISYYNMNEGNGNVVKSLIKGISIESELTSPDWNQSIHIDQISSINNTSNKPELYSLSQNYPNPFNPSTNIRYSVMNNEIVKLKVYDVLGNEITTLVNEMKSAGNYEVTFNTADQSSGKFSLSSGIYFYKISIGNYTQTKKMMLIK
jgi:PKD repeat protein